MRQLDALHAGMDGLKALDSDDIRQRSCDEIFDALQRAADRLEAAAQRHGALLGSQDAEAWAEASRDLVAAKANYYALNQSTRRVFTAIAHEAGVPVVFETTEGDR